MKSYLLRTVALPVILAGPAMAADLPLKARPVLDPVFNWTGFYVGVNAGEAWARSDLTTTVSCAAPPPGFFNYFCGPGFGQANAAAVAAAGTGSITASAFTGGGQVGYNKQYDRLVLGGELDLDSFNINGSRQVGGVFPFGNGRVPFPPGRAFTISSAVSTNWLFTARGRAGWAFDNLLVYVTAGLAVTDLHLNNSYLDNVVLGPGRGTWNASAARLGGTIGGGLEWALSRSWSVKAEYLYLYFGSISATGMIVNPNGGGGGNPAGYANAISTSADLTAQIARAGLNYRF